MATPKTTTYSWLVLLIVIAVAIVFILGVCVPKWSDIKAAKIQRVNTLALLEQKKNTLKAIEEVRKEYDANLTKVRRLEMALPSEEDIPGLIVQVRDMAIEAGVGVESADFGEAKRIKGEKPAAAPAQDIESTAATYGEGGGGAVSSTPSSQNFTLQEVPISIVATGSYDNLKRFLDVVGSNLRLLEISSVSLASQEGTGNFSLLLNAKAYILSK